MIELYRYRTAAGRVPVTTWFKRLRDPRGRARLEIRSRRLAAGLFGDTRALGGGLHELRDPTGPGYRLYFGQHGTSLVILLCAGDKSSQRSDIRRARVYWEDWQRRNL